MNDLISRQAAINALREMPCKSDKEGYVWIIRSDAWAKIDNLPSAQKKGEWIKDSDQDYACVCSVCRIRMDIIARFLFSYCPNCGTDMRRQEK